MKILIVGNLGYVGSVLASHLRSQYSQYELHGIDNAYFAHCLTVSGEYPEQALDCQRFADVRALDPQDLAGFDAVVQLAAVSNDPMGKQFEAATMSINLAATTALARAAATAGVRSFVFASSCSVYGLAEGDSRRESDPVAPLTAYARSKIIAESELHNLPTDMAVTVLRFATACGMSPRLRLDLVVNDFVASALTAGSIQVLSDGTPWRPLIDVEDMARAIDWAIHRETDRSDRFLIVNTGASDHNYQVKDIAEAVARAIPGTTVSINTDAPADSRSYRVDFGLYEQLAPNFVPRLRLDDSIQRLVNGLCAAELTARDWRTSSFIRLQVLQDHVRQGRLTSDLRWVGRRGAVDT